MRIPGFSLEAAFSHNLGGVAPSSRVFEHEIEAILDQARWAPSGDNTQPWRFEIVNDSQVVVHILSDRMRTKDFYSGLDDRAIFLTGGVLLETMRIAASVYHRSLSWMPEGEDQGVYRIAVTLTPDAGIVADPLAEFIIPRSVARYAYRMTPLKAAQKQALADALGSKIGVVWREAFEERWRAAILNAITTDIRLRIPETFETHKNAIDWEQNYSPTAIPARAVGLDRLSLALMHWLMHDWKRLNFMNRFAGGTLLARVELDLIPGLLCGAHFIIYDKEPRPTIKPEAQIRMGQSLQRFWLTATAAGLVMQPAYATLALAWSAQRGFAFTGNRHMIQKAAKLQKKLAVFTGIDPEAIVFLGRLGVPRSRRVLSRSLRQPLEALILKVTTRNAS